MALAFRRVNNNHLLKRCRCVLFLLVLRGTIHAALHSLLAIEGIWVLLLGVRPLLPLRVPHCHLLHLPSERIPPDLEIRVRRSLQQTRVAFLVPVLRPLPDILDFTLTLLRLNLLLALPFFIALWRPWGERGDGERLLASARTVLPGVAAALAVRGVVVLPARVSSAGVLGVLASASTLVIP